MQKQIRSCFCTSLVILGGLAKQANGYIDFDLTGCMKQAEHKRRSTWMQTHHAPVQSTEEISPILARRRSKIESGARSRLGVRRTKNAGQNTECAPGTQRYDLCFLVKAGVQSPHCDPYNYYGAPEDFFILARRMPMPAFATSSMAHMRQHCSIRTAMS